MTLPLPQDDHLRQSEQRTRQAEKRARKAAAKARKAEAKAKALREQANGAADKASSAKDQQCSEFWESYEIAWFAGRVLALWNEYCQRIKDRPDLQPNRMPRLAKLARQMIRLCREQLCQGAGGDAEGQ